MAVSVRAEQDRLRPRSDGASRGGPLYRGESGAKDFKLNPDSTWEAIEKNVDGLGAFFHVLMTREYIPLIDYEQTFPSANLYTLTGLRQDIHPNHSIYQSIKQAAQEKIRRVDVMRLRADRARALAKELRAVGYECRRPAPNSS